MNMTPRPDILTITARYFDYLAPHLCELSVREITQGLSNECRFAGQCIEFYSVAQHSVLLSYIVPKHLAMQGLVHDGGESVLKDIPKPLKNLLGDYQIIERSVEEPLFASFGLPAKLDPAIKKADIVMRVTEQRDLMPAHSGPWHGSGGAQPLAKRIVPWSPRRSRYEFARRYQELATGRNPSLGFRAHLLAAIYLPRSIRPEWPELAAKNSGMHKFVATQGTISA